MNDPQLRQRCQEQYQDLLPRLADYVSLHARTRPDALAIIEHDTGEHITWKKFDQAVTAFSSKLLSIGLNKGDVVATSLPMLKEHIYLEYACFKLGILIAPLDLRLKVREVMHAFESIRPRACFFLGSTPKADFRPLFREVMASAPYCQHWVQFQAEPEGILEGAQHIKEFARDMKWQYIRTRLTGVVKRAARAVGRRDPALIIFTTGSTGLPKPALLCHENILVQNIGLAVAFGVTSGERMLVNLPPSHVGCQTEQLMTTIYGGGTSVVLHIFDAQRSLQAIQQHQVTVCGQIPALFAMQWRLPDYESFDLSSLRFAIYGGQAVDRPFLERLGRMARQMGSGLGLTETAGFCTYTPAHWGPDEIGDSIGFDTPLCPISIREPMQADGSAGAEKPPGETGEICFSGPQVFLGYLNDDENTRKTISTDGLCYTGDLGWYDQRGLHFAGRSKFIIKPKGFQVFPAEVEHFITDAFQDRVVSTGCVGVKHAVFSEAIVAVVELREGAALEVAEIQARVKEMAAYKRPSHYIFVEQGQMPLNRVAKLDYLALGELAGQEIAALRAAGGWDQG